MGKKRIIAILLMLCMVFTLTPQIVFAEGENSGISVTLDNGEYDTTYKTNYGTVQYSIDQGANWKEISVDTTSSDNGSQKVYTVADVSSIDLKVTSVNASGSFYLITSANQQLTADTPVTIGEGCHLEFRNGGGPQPPEPSGENHTITTNAGEHGTIDNPTPITVQDHGNQIIFITPDYGYEIDTVVIDKNKPEEHTLDVTELDEVVRQGGYNFQEVISDHTIDVTFKEMNPAPPVFNDYESLKARIENTLYAYAEGYDAVKDSFCYDLWDMMIHEYAGAFANKVELNQAVSIGALSQEGDEVVLGLSYCEYQINLTDGITASGRIYLLQENEILIKAVNKAGNPQYKIVSLTPTTNFMGEPSYEDAKVTIDYDSVDSIELGGAHIEGKTGLTEYCVSYHIALPVGGCQLFVYKPDYRGAIANVTGEDKRAMAYDFGNTPFVVFNDTTAENPYILKTFFGYGELTIQSQSEDIVIVSVATDLPSSAVSVSGAKVTFLSNYYDLVPITVKYTYQGVEAIGYVLIQRVGLDIQKYTKTNVAETGQTNHGTQPGIVFEWAGNDCAIFATYYYPSAQSEAVDLYCTYTWKDGTVTTELFTDNIYTDGDEMFTSMDDFCVYKGKAENQPVNVSIIAVKEGAFGTSSFGGAKFGSGAGVTWQSE